MIVYIITNLVNNKKYIGITKGSMRKRWNKHVSDTNSNRRYHLHNAINKYGTENFLIEELEGNIKSLNSLKKRENYWIKKLGTLSPNGYNLTTGGEIPEFSRETRKKLSLANSGIHNPMYGKKHSKESILKMREHKCSDELKQKLSKMRLGTTLSQSTKDKISKAFKGRKLSEAHKKKIGKKNKGKVRSLEAKKRVSDTMISRKTSSGERNGRAIITQDQVMEIKQKRKDGVKVGDMSKTYKISTTAIYNILNNKSWQ